MIVTIDGPAGAGKSHVARALAEKLGFRFLDTGAMYRAVALAALREGINVDDANELADLSDRVLIELKENRVLLNSEDVTEEIRTPSVTSATSRVADNQAIRRRLVELQRQIVADQDTVTEGRDQGTVAFPNALCKIFLTASPEERARRRLAELRAQGENISFEELLAQQNDRDQRDAGREIGKLYRAEDAVEVFTDGLTPDEVVDRLQQIVSQKQSFE